MQKRNSKGQFDKNSIPWNNGLKKSDIRVLNYIKKGRETRIINNSYVPWNKGLKKETDCRVKKYAEKLKGKTRKDIPWNKGIHTNFHSKTEWKKGNIPWNKGLTKETDERVKRNAESVKKTHWTKKSKHEVDKITEKMRLARLSQKFPRKFTKIEVILSDAIKKENIKFINHKNILNITEVDIFIEPNICIYCDGDY